MLYADELGVSDEQLLDDVVVLGGLIAATFNGLFVAPELLLDRIQLLLCLVVQWVRLEHG